MTGRSHAREGGCRAGWLNRFQHPDGQCNIQQNSLLAVHATNYSTNMKVDQFGAHWGGFGGTSWAMRRRGRGASGALGWELQLCLQHQHKPLQFSSKVQLAVDA